jgi:DNA-binding transcriptional ArsR family regulator
MGTDLVFKANGLVATVEFKSGLGDSFSIWTVTGLDSSNLPVLLLRAVLPLAFSDEASARTAASKVFESHIMPLATLASAAGGMVVNPTLDDAHVTSVFSAHAGHFQSSLGQLNAESVSSTLVTGGLYRLAKVLGVKKPVSTISSYLELPESTVSRRLTRLRDSGLIEKRGGGRNA